MCVAHILASAGFYRLTFRRACVFADARLWMLTQAAGGAYRRLSTDRVAMFLGAMIFFAWKRRNPAGAEQLGFSIASGLIAGEGLMGIIVAVLTLLGIEPLT